ncbi:hypothetical protein KGN64_003198 [Salmonella enterica]|nr:hypothetical protein [Salmonella enterica]EHM5264015.1 hypothetical protein [Salmonella enterica]
MKINDVRHVVITVTKSQLDDYLSNPPYWTSHSLSRNTPEIDSILEDIFCAKSVKQLVSKEYPQSDFNGQIGRRYRYSAERYGYNTWRWSVKTVINTDSRSRSCYTVSSGEFTVDFIVTDDTDKAGVACFTTEPA